MNSCLLQESNDGKGGPRMKKYTKTSEHSIGEGGSNYEL